MDDEDYEHPIPEPDPIVAKLFADWRSPRFGGANPERMNNPVWEWFVKSRIDSYAATQRFNGPSALETGPTWCFYRFGQSTTKLPDGRTVRIAGEHEDSYDPDFCIYNDVVVAHANGALDIFGYPRDVFAPTDFHTATVLGDRILIIGSLGYPDDRRPGTTPVYELDLTTFKIFRIETRGRAPGWIHSHLAELNDNAIRVTRGKLESGTQAGLVENIDDWDLRLSDFTWERLTRRKWEQWELRRRDGNPNNLWRIRSDYMTRSAGLSEAFERQMAETSPLIAEILRNQEKVQPTDLAGLYRPDLPHEFIEPLEEEHGIHRIIVRGITVRYVEDMYAVRMTCEGELPFDLVERLIDDLQTKLSSAENTIYESRRIVTLPT